MEVALLSFNFLGFLFATAKVASITGMIVFLIKAKLLFNKVKLLTFTLK